MTPPIDANKSLDTDAATLLALEMSEISERYWCASWLMGLEFELWNMLQGGEREYGMGEVEPSEIAELCRLHEKSGGWCCWPDNADGGIGPGVTFVTTEEWLRMVNGSGPREKSYG